MTDKKKRSASERIEDLEAMVMGLYQTMDNMARDLITVKDASKLFLNRLEAVIKAAQREGGITESTVEKIMIETNILKFG